MTRDCLCRVKNMIQWNYKKFENNFIQVIYSKFFRSPHSSRFPAQLCFSFYKTSSVYSLTDTGIFKEVINNNVYLINEEGPWTSTITWPWGNVFISVRFIYLYTKKSIPVLLPCFLKYYVVSEDQSLVEEQNVLTLTGRV